MILKSAGVISNAMLVNAEGKGEIFATCIPLQYYANVRYKSFYSAVISVTPTGAGDCFFYLKNDSSDDLIVTSLKTRGASTEKIQIKLGDSGTVGGTHAALTPISRHAGSNKPAEVTCESGVDITNLSGGSVVDIIYCETKAERWFWDSRLVVPKNTIMSFYAVTGAVALEAVVGFYFCGICS